MRKQITAIVIASMLAIMAPIAASAQKYDKKDREYRNRTYSQQQRVRTERRTNDRYYEDGYYDDGYYGYEEPNVYDRHRKAINIGVATGAGAILGAMIGGKKGALIGAAAGVAGGAIFTKVQKPRNYPKPRY
ncbi:MAG: hypothetical protein AB7J13_11750 [Pyrinomonadaceae bacterium]